MEDSDSNPYQILHLNPSSVTVDEVKNAYRRMALLYHPDKCNGDDAVFNQVKSAYQSIMNELKGKTSTYTYQSLKENYKQFNNSQTAIPHNKSPSKRKSTTRQNRSKVEQTDIESVENEVMASETPVDFNLDKFNQKFVEVQQKKSEIPINLTDEDFKEKKDNFFQNKKNIEEELNRLGKMFTTSAAFDRNIFNRQFEHFNGDKEHRSKELAEYESNEPLPMTSSNLDQFSSIYGERQKQQDSDFYVPNNQFETLDQNELTKNPAKIDQQLSDKFCTEKDVTTQDPIDPNHISQKIKEYKNNIHVLSQKAKATLSQKC